MDNIFSNGITSEPEIMITFCLSGSKADLNEISERLGLIPSRARTPDDWPEAIKHPKQELPDYLKPCYSWDFRLRYETCKDVSVKFDKMIAILKGKEKIINELKEKFALEVSFGVGIHAQHDQCNMPAVYLTKEIIEFLASIHAGIGFDMYLD